MLIQCLALGRKVCHVLALLALVVAAKAATPLVLYVAPDGNDDWSGRLTESSPDKKDGPLQSLVGARDKLRLERKKSDKTPGPITVYIRAGIYQLDTPILFEPEDSGTAEAPVVYAAYQDERPIFTGGRVITGWQQKGHLWQCRLRGAREILPGQTTFQQLWVNGQRRQRARSPNSGYHRIARLLPGPPQQNTKAVARDQFVFHPGDIRSWERLNETTVTLMHSWETSIHPIRSVDLQSNVVHFAAPMKEWWSIGHWEDEQRYYVENAIELLDQPGEWYLNRETEALSYWPMPGEKMDEVEIVLPVLTELVRFAGNPDQEKWVRHIALKGLTFHHADWVLDPKGNSSTQAAVEVPAAMMADGALNCAIEECEVAHIGTYGIWFRRGCKDNRIQGNRLFDLGAGAIRVGETRMAKTDQTESSRNLLDNNHIFEGGRIYAGCVGIWVAQSSGNRISHNDIHDLNYTGISIGWNWGLEANRTSNNIVEFNHVHDLGHGVMSDAGLIYCLGVSPGSVIRNNIFHDMWPYSRPPFGWGIYLDAQCGNYLVESNLVYNTQSGGLMFNNGGHEHVIRNNIFALGADYALWPYSEKRPSTFRRNIVYLTQGKLFIPYGERSLNERLAAKESPGDWDENLYWHTGGIDEIQFYQRNFDEWRAVGLDPHSLIADPQFVDAAEADFRLLPDSPALKLGFQFPDLRTAGLYGDPEWANEASHKTCTLKPLPSPPPPPQPLQLQDGFEATPLGARPVQAQVSGEEAGASIRVTNKQAASGKQSLRIMDAQALQPSWQPHFFYEPHYSRGIVRQRFEVWMDPETQFFTEWRDSSGYPENVGPSVRFAGNGQVSVGGKVLATIPNQTWVHVEIQAPVGKNSPRQFKLTLTMPGKNPTIFEQLPFAGNRFAQLHWLGFSSTAAADTSFYLDNLVIHLEEPK